MPALREADRMEVLTEIRDYLQDLNLASMVLRLVLAMVCGGIVGYDRGKKRRPAGLRTYMLVCMGAALTILISQFQNEMFSTVWSDAGNDFGHHTDVSRYGAQVINGIGFLGAGTILVTANQQVKGMTTAAGLWASACMGLAIGAGFYEVAVLGVFLIWITVKEFARVEKAMTSRTKNMNIYVEIDGVDDIGAIIECLKKESIRIYDVEVQKSGADGVTAPSAIFSLRLPKHRHHAEISSKIAAISAVRFIQEI